MEQRRLRVYPKYVFRTSGELIILSEIRLKGHWLNDWGFKVGEFIRLKKIDKGIIIIKNFTAEAPIIEL